MYKGSLFNNPQYKRSSLARRATYKCNGFWKNECYMMVSGRMSVT